MFAKVTPELNYDPNCVDWKKKRELSPPVYWRQGLPIGRLDSALESMIVEDASTQRLMSFGEFESAYYDSSTSLSASFGSVTDLFVGFHPKSRPVLWRILLAQAHILSASTRKKYLLRTGNADEELPWTVGHIEDRDQLDWRTKVSNNDEEIALIEPFVVAEAYLANHLKKHVEFSERTPLGT